MAKALYNNKIREQICEGLAEGKSLRKVCLQSGFPSPQTVIRWVNSNDYPDFTEQYAQARKTAYQLLADELCDLADDDSKDRTNPQAASRSRLQLETRKWMLSKMLPKIYGDKLMIQGDSENPLITEAAEDTSKLSVEELQLLLELKRKMKPNGDGI